MNVLDNVNYVKQEREQAVNSSFTEEDLMKELILFLQNQKNSEDANLSDLLLSNFVSIVNKEDKISIGSFINAFGFIEFNERGKNIFSQITNLNELKVHKDAINILKQAKNMPTIPRSEELEYIVNELEDMCGDEPIGTLRSSLETPQETSSNIPEIDINEDEIPF